MKLNRTRKNKPMRKASETNKESEKQAVEADRYGEEQAIQKAVQEAIERSNWNSGGTSNCDSY